MKQYSICALLAGLVAVMVAPAWAAPRPALKDLGRSVKMRILVDKVMQPTRNWKTEEWMVKETAEAGFNVFSPRRGAEDLNEVKKVTAWCGRHGLYHMPWMRGVEGVPEDRSLSDGRRMVWADGAEQMLWSPNSDELWEWMAGEILPYAELSAKDETLMGVFLDYENYWPGGRGNLYELSYDDLIMKKFAASRNLALPALELKARKAWLEEQKLHEEFAKFQINHWRQKCRELRQAVDKHNPRFEFCIYPAPGTMFMLEACYPEWATAQAPLVLADPWIYGRPGRYTAHEAALKSNQAILERGLKLAKDKGINFIYIGGIDPVVTGADPEFSGKNALMSAGVTDGYWIFYEGPTYDTTHREYFKWFTWANRKMEAGDFAAAWQPRETDDPWGFPKIRVSGQPLPRTEKREYPLVQLRGTNALLVSGHRDVPVTVSLQATRIGRNEAPIAWTMKDQDWSDLAKGEVALGTVGTLSFKPPKDQVYVLLLEGGGSAVAVKDSNVPLAIFADPEARLIYGAERLYFKVPAGVKEFTLAMRGGGGVETVKLTVMDPAGAVAATAEATPDANSFKLPVPVKGQEGQVWSLAVDKAAAGVLEDNALSLDKQLPRVLSYFADEVFAIEVK